MSFIDWNAAALPSQIQGQNTQNQQAQYNLMQQQRGVNALQNVNLSDAGSVNNALQGLLKAGAVDQAKGLTELAMTRGVNSASLPVIQNALGLAARELGGASSDSQAAAPPTEQSSDQQQPDLEGAHRQILQQGADATNDLLSYQDPVLRAAAADVYRQKFGQMGIPQQNLDEVFGDLSDKGLQQHAAYLTSVASGQDAQHPTGYAATQSVFNANNPGSQQAIATLQGHLANPIVQAALAKAGLDVSPGVNQAIAITGPARSAAASAPYNPVSLEGPQGQPVQMSAANFAAGQAQPGAQPVVGATPGVKAAQTAAASAPYQPVTLPPGPGGEQRTESAAQFAEGRGAPNQPGQITGPANAPPVEGPTIARTAGLAGGAQSSIVPAQNFETYSNGYNQRKANLDNLRLAAGDISTGPQSPFWGKLGALAAEYGIKTPLTPTANQAAAYEEVQKMAQSVLAQQKDTLGLPNTNQSVNLATGATPHESTSPLGLQRLAGVLEGNEDYINATRQAWETWKSHGNGYETFQQFVPQFMQTFHPQVFQAQYLDPPEQAKVRQQFGPARFDAETKVAQRLGYLNAGQ